MRVHSFKGQRRSDDRWVGTYSSRRTCKRKEQEHTAGVSTIHRKEGTRSDKVPQNSPTIATT